MSGYADGPYRTPEAVWSSFPLPLVRSALPRRGARCSKPQ